MRKPRHSTGRKSGMKDEKFLHNGLIGGGIAAICCFTLFLVVIVAGAGLSAIVGSLDYALFPLLFTSLGVVAHALWIRAGRPGRCPRNLIIVVVIALSALLFWLEFRYALRLSASAAIAVVLYDYRLRRIANSDPESA
jgi:mercuric ion transport protein